MSKESVLPFHDWLVGLRRHFHQYPELSYKEEKTAAKIAETLRELGIECKTGIGGTGVVGSLSASRPGPTVALRADMDALPLEELNDVPYRSKVPGVMHACGHDGHVTMALGTARNLIEQKWPETGSGKALFIFQPAEESGAGARAMLESGAFDSEPVDAIFAGHMHPEMPAGYIGIAPEICNAASDTISIRIIGKGGHGAQPHLCIDPIIAAAHLVTQIQSIVSRGVPPLESVVITIGKLNAGTARNVIPEEAVMEGTMRTLRPHIRERVMKRLTEMVEGLRIVHGVSISFAINQGYPLLVNNPDLAQYVKLTAGEIVGADFVRPEPPRMGAEDFAYFVNRWPGVLMRIGCRRPDSEFMRGLHSPRFDFDESALSTGVRLFTALLAGYAESSKVEEQRR